MADQPLPPAQPWERHESQRLVFDMPPLVRLTSTPAAEAQDAAPTAPPRLRSVGGHWRTVYQAELASLSIAGLVQEQQKQERMVAKAERDDLPWLPKARARLDAVAIEWQRRLQKGWC